MPYTSHYESDRKVEAVNFISVCRIIFEQILLFMIKYYRISNMAIAKTLSSIQFIKITAKI